MGGTRNEKNYYSDISDLDFVDVRKSHRALKTSFNSKGIYGFQNFVAELQDIYFSKPKRLPNYVTTEGAYASLKYHILISHSRKFIHSFGIKRQK